MSDEKKLHMPDGNIHVFGANQAGKTTMAVRSAAERSAFLINQLEAQVAKTQTAAKFLAAKLDTIKKLRDAYEDAPEALGQALVTFLEKLDDVLANKSGL